MRTRSVLLASALGLLALVLGACSDDGGSSETEDTEASSPETTETTAATTTTAAEEAFEVEDSPVAASLDQPYGPPGADPIVEPGSAGILWYDGGETWVAVFVGLDLDALGPVCPGSSMEVSPATFDFNSNTPTEEGACEGFTTPEATVRRCGSALVYQSLVPMDAEGTLYASLERPDGQGGIEGITSMVQADAAAAPAIDPTASAYLTPDGEFACDA